MIIILGGLLFSSCQKYLDVNTTPNNPTSVPASTLLPNTTIGLAFANANDLNRATSALVQHIAGVANQTQLYDVYALDGNFDNQWNLEIYSGCIDNLQILINQDSTTSPAYSGIAKLEMAYVFSMATDIWGAVPYSQAGQGLIFPTPRFDKVEDIYQGNSALGIRSLFDLVNSGLADLGKVSLLKPGTDDIVYKGDLTKWQRMGNTLLLKFAMLISNLNPTLAKTTIQNVITGNNYINSPANEFAVPFSLSVGNQNPIFSFNNLNRPADQMLSQRLLNLSKSLNDTVRLAKFFTKPTGAFVAFDNGLTIAAAPQAQRSKYNTYLTGDRSGNTADGKSGGDSSIKILTASQVDFILAESALILGTTGDPNALYQAGITASMQRVGMTATEIATYFSTNPTVVTLAGTPEQKRQQIITQKYMSLIGNGIEAFDDYRRTGYPVLTLVNNPQGDDPAVIPTRLPYTPNELSRNPNAPNPRPKTDVKLIWAK